jgi:WD40 repeat protein
MGALVSGFLSGLDNERSESGRYQFSGRLAGHSDGVLAMSFSPDGKFLASGGWSLLHINALADDKQAVMVFASGGSKTDKRYKYRQGGQRS